MTEVFISASPAACQQRQLFACENERRNFPGAWQCNLKQVAWRGLTDLGSEHFQSTHTDKYVQCSSRKTPDYVLLHDVF